VPSAYAPPVTNFNQGQPFEPIVPSSPYASQVRSEPGLGSTGIAEIPEPAGSGAWFNEAAAADAGFNSNAHFDSILPGAHDIEDLPTCTETRELHLPRFRIALHKAVRIAQDDLYVATILAATACMSGILLLTLMMKSCG
jgi:hypothetical protein